MTPRGASRSSCPGVTEGGKISQYTWASRTRRAMSCVTCDPKSMIATPPGFIWVSSLAENPGAARPPHGVLECPPMTPHGHPRTHAFQKEWKDRRLGVVMFLDMVGYSSHMSKSEVHALARVQHLSALIHETAPAYG